MQETLTIDLSKLFPRIKPDLSHASSAKDILKGGPSIEIPADEQPYTEPLFEDLLLLFAIDKGKQYELLKQGIFKKMGIPSEALKARAISNMINEVGNQIRSHETPNGVSMLTAGGNHEACLVLIPGLWEQIGAKYHENYVIALPARDLLFAAPSDKPGAIAELQGFIDRTFERLQKTRPSELISRSMYKRDGEGWKIA